MLASGGEDLLRQVSTLKINRGCYHSWVACMGRFLSVLKTPRFLTVLPLDLLGFDLSSQAYSYQSRSYLLPILKKHATREDLGYFCSNFLPLIQSLRSAREQERESEIKKKKLEALIQ